MSRSLCNSMEDVQERGIKNTERLRRVGRQAPNVNFNDQTVSTMSGEKFFSNENNKREFIKSLSEKLVKKGYYVHQAVEDADTMIIKTAIDKANSYSTIIIVGEDIDLLVLLTDYASEKKNIFFRKEGKGKIQSQLYSADSFIIPDLKKYIPFIHAFCGCDTTSAFYRQGKGKLVKLLNKRKDL